MTTILSWTRSRRVIGWLVVGLLVPWGGAPGRVAAQDQGARLELSAERLPAGGTLGVRGKSFDAATAVSLELQSAAGSVALGAAVTDAAGAFETRVVVPKEIAPGAYTLQALRPEHAVVSAPLLIAEQLPAAATGAQRDAAAPLLQPGSATASATTMPVPTPTDSPPLPWWLPLALVFALAGLGVAYLHRGRQLLR